MLTEQPLTLSRSATWALDRDNSRSGDGRQQLFPLLVFLFRHATEQFDGLTQAETGEVRTEYLHGIEHRYRAGLPGYRREHQRHGVAQLQLQVLDHRLDTTGDLVLFPLTQRLQLPQDQLHDLTHLIQRQLLVLEKLGVGVDPAGEEERRVGK